MLDATLNFAAALAGNVSLFLPIPVEMLPNVDEMRNVITWVGAMREERVSCLNILPDRKLRRGDVAPFLLRTKFISLRAGGI